MAEALILEFEGVGRDEYEAVSDLLGIDMGSGAGEWPPGLLIHTAGATENGWAVLEVWESREAQEAFMNERLAGRSRRRDRRSAEPRGVARRRVTSHARAAARRRPSTTVDTLNRARQKRLKVTRGRRLRGYSRMSDAVGISNRGAVGFRLRWADRGESCSRRPRRRARRRRCGSDTRPTSPATRGSSARLQRARRCTSPSS